LAKKTIGFDAVRKIGLALPGAEAGTAFGSPALKVNGKMFACMAVHRSAEPGSLVVLIDFDARVELLAAEPDVYYITDHYVGYPSVLVRLSRVHRDALPDLLRGAWRLAAASAKPRARRRKTANHL
jgi:hypothetical protein